MDAGAGSPSAAALHMGLHNLFVFSSAACARRGEAREGGACPSWHWGTLPAHHSLSGGTAGHGLLRSKGISPLSRGKHDFGCWGAVCSVHRKARAGGLLAGC